MRGKEKKPPQIHKTWPGQKNPEEGNPGKDAAISGD